MDRTAVDYLAHVANVPDVDAFADEMFRAKSNMDGLDIHEVRGAVRPGAAFACTRGLICNGALVICVPPGVIQIVSTDYKQFSMVGTKLGFGVVETIHPQEMIDRKVRWASVGWIPFLGRERSPGAFDWIALPQMEILDGIRALKAQDGGEIGVMGGISLVRQLVFAGFMDELSLITHPVVAGKGRHLFEPGDPTTRLDLIRCDVTSKGNVIQVYRRRAG